MLEPKAQGGHGRNAIAWHILKGSAGADEKFPTSTQKMAAETVRSSWSGSQRAGLPPRVLRDIEDGVVHLGEDDQVHRKAGAAVLGGRIAS